MLHTASHPLVHISRRGAQCQEVKPSHTTASDEILRPAERSDGQVIAVRDSRLPAYQAAVEQSESVQLGLTHIHLGWPANTRKPVSATRPSARRVWPFSPTGHYIASLRCFWLHGCPELSFVYPPVGKNEDSRQLCA